MCAKAVHRGPPRPRGILVASRRRASGWAKQVNGFMRPPSKLRKRAKGPPTTA
jgi:hypothetical protein